ncbi:multidrug ABC transporter ATP-binding protein [Alicyclobacillus cellulosilyticus]|uniref:Multidrug ABC transporter ATP-binding protein n=1 Tax=Alicyclobacillus cellulosilyticus TaxID=1003997 RepID=A0A917KIF1_9BACL|nr:ABC transporter ATP-binding protein [Alicyclobacillus cellulosilyticus]GGJ12573.1 multidrug ABC transporter ATP-binding protein [Alicyclobacillus cellulosilyticus]
MAEARNVNSLQPNPFQMVGLQPGPMRGPVVKARAKDGRTTIVRLWAYLRQRRAHLWLVVVSTAVATFLTLYVPYLLGRTVDTAIAFRNPQQLTAMCLLLMAVYLISVAATFVQQYVAVSVSQQTVKEMRRDLFAKLLRLPLSVIDQRSHGDLMSRVTNDIANVSNTLNQTVTQFLASIMSLAGCLAMMIWQSLWMTLVTITVIPVTAFIAQRVAKFTRRCFAEQQRELGQVNGFVAEMVSGEKIVQLFHQEQRVTEQFRERNDRLRRVCVRAQSISGSMGPVMNMMRNLSFAVIAFAGGVFAYHHVITVGVIVSFLNYASQFSQPVNQLANQYNLVQAAIAGAERVFEIMDQPSESDGQEHDTIVPGHLRGEVVFDHVSFSYEPDCLVLKDVSLHAKPGETIALVGPTGAGKTTMVSLLTRFYDADQGAIYIDGIDIRRFDKEALRRQLGIVLQEAYLFSGTIRENIRFGRLDATDEEVEAAARLANADHFIRRLPDGYDTYIRPEGTNLSHGQRQLVTIARAILANPSILILDEATSSVDTRTELQIQEALWRLMRGRTSFVIAHRLGTIRRAHQILVIDGGRVVERGTHEALLAQQGVYYRLYQAQWARFA